MMLTMMLMMTMTTMMATSGRRMLGDLFYRRQGNWGEKDWWMGVLGPPQLHEYDNNDYIKIKMKLAGCKKGNKII